ncbi:MAG: GNAT family N-acetyltransferase [Bacillota bacterium]|nr:GNAT family N-acetyltransferase [Bacillota bacterium]
MEIREIVYGSQAYEETIDLRNEYFRKPQGLNIRDEDLSGDADLHMYGAYIDDRLMGTVFYKDLNDETAQVKALIVDEKYRGLGYGKFLMNFVEEKIRDQGYKEAILQGRVSAQGLYEKLGYKGISEVFDFNTIPHLWMKKIF